MLVTCFKSQEMYVSVSITMLSQIANYPFINTSVLKRNQPLTEASSQDLCKLESQLKNNLVHQNLLPLAFHIHDISIIDIRTHYIYN